MREVSVQGSDGSSVGGDRRCRMDGVVGQHGMVHHELKRKIGDQPDWNLDQSENRGGQVPTTKDVLDEGARYEALASRDPDRCMGKLDREQLADANLDLLVRESLQERSALGVVLLGLDERLHDQARVEGQSTGKNHGTVKGVDAV